MKHFELLEQLLLEKSYEELTASELSLVEELMTAGEYHAQRELLLRVDQVFPAAPLPPASLSGNLQKAVLAKQRTGYSYLKIMGIAAALTGCFLLGRWSLPIEELEATPIADEAATVPAKMIHDTIYLEKTIEKAVPKYIYRDRVVRDTVYIQAFADKGLLPEGFLVKENSQTTASMALEKSQNARKTSRVLEMIVDVY